MRQHASEGPRICHDPSAPDACKVGSGGGDPLAPVVWAGGGWQHDGMDYVLAQVNIGRLREPLDSPRLAGFVYSATHRAVLQRRREWFERMAEAYTALWWIPRGTVPSTQDAEDRIRLLRAHGPTARAFTLKMLFPPPDAADTTPRPGHAGWTCPV